jgi:hypothetical protein
MPSFVSQPIVMTGLDPVIHVLQPDEPKTWMAGSSPAMTTLGGSDIKRSFVARHAA